MEQSKIDAPMIGSDGNIFNQVAIASIALKENGQRKQAKEMSDKVFRAESYEAALSIISEYVNPVDKTEYMRTKGKGNRDIER